MVKKVFYASSGRANIIGAHRHWREGRFDPSEVSITFSSQIQDLCVDLGAEGLFTSDRGEAETLKDGAFTFLHRPKRPASGLGYYWEDLRYAFMMLREARAFGADVAILDSGVTQFFMMALFPLFGIPVIPVLHNSLWASGFRPTSMRQRVIQWLDRRFWRRVPLATLAVSTECERQVDEIAGPKHRPVVQVRAQFRREMFDAIPPADPDATPFHVMFIGRVVEEKGVLDIPLMARWIEDRAPGAVRWTLCGKGTALEAVRASIRERGLEGVVETPGWMTLEQIQDVYAKSHASIVPTRSGFCEGLAMTAAEAILAGRPLISNPIVPALEILQPAAMAARAEDYESHAQAVLALAQDRALYRRLQAACAPLAAQFYDREQGLEAVLRRVIETI
ncbi:glycosyltransferase family 4 protein [Sphingomonas sp.]|uniref:glycosyltransferase family 4 protein n=1 Tax=Sphingomonas sp. TaxID=28214 RepID=UPI000DB35967|nr:glycosyltransferase family 4 protein [Sphingomonas sp.]PZU07963.1 MAG: hypothetical protein DI605_13860 [Sphingomonas sp.]